MKAKDTVMGIDKYNEIARAVSEKYGAIYEEADSLGPELTAQLEAQDEISYKAGMRKVAGFIKRNLSGLVSKDEEVFAKAWEMYDAQLKEWGIDKEVK